MPILRNRLCLVLKNGDSDKEEDTVNLTASILTGIKQEMARLRQQEKSWFLQSKKANRLGKVRSRASPLSLQGDDTTYACDKGYY